MSSIVEKASDAIKDITAALDATSISENRPAETDQVTKDPQKEAVIASAAEGRRLYIGNLAYATTEDELQDFFKGYKIESISIPKNPRTDRPVGYAFVDLSSSAEAERAIEELSGKGILDRKVSVQLARKPEPIFEKNGTASGETGSGGEGGTGRRRISGRGRGRGRGRAGRAGRDPPSSHEKSGESQPVEAAPAVTEPSENKAITEKKEPKENKPVRAPRERRERGPPADGIPSKTKVMVANLPYDLSEEKLKELFADYEPISAKIALRPIPRFMVKKLQARNEPRKGRGFGFVNLASNENQSRAVSEMNGREVEGREIAVKIAIDSPEKVFEDTNNQATENAGEAANGGADLYDGTNGNNNFEGTNGVAHTDGINGSAETSEAKA
ncbi:Single-stranded TG1-3 DNA-binding protein [Golovinomyces cichoracearum]|uniref:Single-stranded TG1-3 DNA-binding protein n=1 Tax=Golovinomyces cichoracearum TaxID=62708 RepID=A0A420IMA9_9PEZI|nr:Single-stranded TG1-3 DNA-binding protein [Golovinomyces cichoracearum]